jgi:hypothetical protein
MTTLAFITTSKDNTYELVRTDVGTIEILFNGGPGYTQITQEEGQMYMERLALLFGKKQREFYKSIRI